MLAVLSGLAFATASAQNAENKLQNKVEAGVHLLGVGANYEFALSGSFVLQGQLSYDVGLFGSSDNVNSISSMVVGVEPRYYYNIHKRNRKGKNTKWNAANFLSVNLSYHPDVLSSVNMKHNVSVNKQIAIAPMWNLRRNIKGSDFNYEFGVGLSFNTIYYEHIKNEHTVDPALNVKIGYNF